MATVSDVSLTRLGVAVHRYGALLRRDVLLENGGVALEAAGSQRDDGRTGRQGAQVGPTVWREVPKRPVRWRATSSYASRLGLTTCRTPRDALYLAICAIVLPAMSLPRSAVERGVNYYSLTRPCHEAQSQL